MYWMDKDLMISSLWCSMLDQLEELCSRIAHEMDEIDDLDKDDIHFNGRGYNAILDDIDWSATEIEATARHIKKLVTSNRKVIGDYEEYCRKTEEVES